MSDVTVTRVAPRGMITLRGDLNAAKMKKAVKDVSGQAMPVSGQFTGDGTRGVAWMSPDEVLVVVPYGEVAEACTRLSAALDGTHHLVANVSDARAVFTLAGSGARGALARVCPVDLHRDTFKAGDFRRSRIAQVPAAFWLHDTGFDVICFRSVGDYVEGVLHNAAKGAAITFLDA